MREFTVREARGRDRDVIGGLWAELMAHHRGLDARFTIAPDGEKKYMRHVQEMMRSSNARVLVAECAVTTRVVGYVMGEMQARPPISLPGLYGFISDIYISDDWRGNGVGRGLYEEVRRWFVTRKAVAVELYIAEANPAARAFWTEMGLRPFLTLMHEDL